MTAIVRPRKLLLGGLLAALVLLALPSPGASQECMACPPCYSTEEHQVVGNLVDWGVLAYGPHPCWGGDCYYSHEPCYIDEDQDDLLVNLAALASTSVDDLERLRQVLERYPRVVVLNLERRAVQVLGCDQSTLVAHIPLRPEAVAELTEG